jgi:IS30 family transposase
MLKSKELTKFEHGEIVGLSKINLSVRKISKVLLIVKSTIQDVINKY